MIAITTEGSYWEIEPTDAERLGQLGRDWPVLVKARPASSSDDPSDYYHWQLATGRIVAITYRSMSEIVRVPRP